MGLLLAMSASRPRVLAACAVVLASWLGCSSPLEGGVIECTPGQPRSCPDGWRCRLDDISRHPRCFHDGPTEILFDAAPALDMGARADAGMDATPREASMDEGASATDAGTDATTRDAGMDADPPEGSTRATCRPEWERLLRISYAPADLEGAWCERVNNPDDHAVGYCGFATMQECQCDWMGRLREDFHCEPLPPELHCMWARRCGSPHEDPTQRRIFCFERLDECIDVVRSWGACDLVLLTSEEDACGAPGEVPYPTSGESTIPLPECCRD